MPSILLNLCWKEYRELKWSTLSALAIALVIPLYTAARSPQDAYSWDLAVLFFYWPMAGLFFGMRAAAGERAARSAVFLHALPVRPELLAVVKLWATMIALVIPVVGLGLLGLWMRAWDESHLNERYDLRIIVALTSLSAIYVALLTGVFGLGRRSELFAAGCGLGALAVWWFALLSSMELLRNVENVCWATFAVTGPPIFLLSKGESVNWRLFCGTALTFAVLAALFVGRYRHGLQPLMSRPRRRLANLDPPQFGWQIAALLWKQACETLPFVLFVLGIAVLLSLAWSVVMVSGEYGRWGQFVDRGQRLAHWAHGTLAVLSSVCCAGGFALSLLLGIIIFAPDLEPRVNTFWRSRPISPHQWFWSKYTLGLWSLLLAVGAPALVCYWSVQYFFYDQPGPAALADEAWILWIPLGWFGIFSAAVLSTCLVRRPLYAGILALGLAGAGLSVAQWLDRGWFQSFTPERPVLVAVIWLLASLVATLIAWQATVRDVALAE